MIDAQRAARQFLVDNCFYAAAGRDDGAAQARAVRSAEASFAAIKPALSALIEAEVDALVAHLRAFPTAGLMREAIDAFALSSDRIIDVAEPLGYPYLSRAARRLRETCRSARQGEAIAPEIFADHGRALQAGLRSAGCADRLSC